MDYIFLLVWANMIYILHNLALFGISVRRVLPLLPLLSYFLFCMCTLSPVQQPLHEMVHRKFFMKVLAIFSALEVYQQGKTAPLGRVISMYSHSMTLNFLSPQMKQKRKRGFKY